MIKYNKLVRDNIINIIEKNGKKAQYHIATENEYSQYLTLKLDEEIKEFKEEYSIEELADVIEVIESLKKIEKYKDVEKLRLEKKKKNGGFEKGIILESVE